MFLNKHSIKIFMFTDLIVNLMKSCFIPVIFGSLSYTIAMVLIRKHVLIIPWISMICFGKELGCVVKQYRVSTKSLDNLKNLLILQLTLEMSEMLK